MRLVIDGYNLLHRMSFLKGVDLEEARKALLEELGRYRRIRGHRITVVFDGMGSGRLASSVHKERGLEVVYTAREDADSWIKRAVRGEGTVVVSSDRGIRDHVERVGSVAVRSEEFIRRMEAAFLQEMKGEGEDDNLPEPSRRLPKRERRRLRVLAKL